MLLPAYGSPFPPLARQEILRLAERLALVERQIAQVEAERDEAARSGVKLSIADVPEDSVAHLTTCPETFEKNACINGGVQIAPGKTFWSGRMPAKRAWD